MNADLIERMQLLAPADGAIVEFGVFQGRSLEMLAGGFPQHDLYGFDTFEGIPPSEVPVKTVTDWVGGFTETSIAGVQARVPRAQLHAGLFADLPPLPELGIHSIAIAHIDADLYEGYRDAFGLVTPLLRVGSLVLMDDLRPTPSVGFEDTWGHPWRAFVEWQVRDRVPLLPLWAVGTSWLWVVADNEYAQRPVLDVVTRETVEGSLRNVAHRLLRRIGR